MIQKTPAFQSTLLLAGLILSMGLAEAKGPDSSVQVAAEWKFGESNDLNYDKWPDDWRRRQGRNYPAYLPIEIIPRAKQAIDKSLSLAERPELDRCLRIELNGGAAVVQSPPVSINSVYSYRVSASILTMGLKHDSAWFEILFMDESGKVLYEETSSKITGDTPWTTLTLDPVSPSTEATQLIVRFHLEPTSQKVDIFGEARFDSVLIEQLPKLSVKTDRPQSLYTPGEQATVLCRISGFPRPVTQLKFRLVDPLGNEIFNHQTTAQQEPGNEVSVGQEVTASWTIPKLGPGFYRVYADLYDGDSKTYTTATTLAFVDSMATAGGPFGWTFGSGHDPITRRQLPGWLNTCRVGTIKYPCWLDPNDQEGADDLTWMLEQLQSQGVQSVGMLDQPPTEKRRHENREYRKPLAPQLRNPEDWRPQLEALMTRLSMRTTWWQIGGEGDHSFLRQPNLSETVDEIRRQLQGFGQPIQVSLSWPWLEPLPEDASGGWKAVCLTEERPFSENELNEYLEANGKQKKADFETWLTLDPLDKHAYTLEDRIRDLVARMIVVQKHDVTGAFVSDPFNSKLGLLNSDATPDEMLLPWRTTAALLGELKFEGSVRMPSGSENAVLSNGERAVMVVWNSEPTDETIYLGENVRQINVWGQMQELSIDNSGPHSRQIVSVGTLPTFLVGIDPAIASFRMKADVERKRLDSVLGRNQPLNLSLTNTFENAVSGQLEFHAPKTWDTDRQSQNVGIEQSGTELLPISISLRSNATIGTETVRFDFNIDSERRHRFSLWREIAVGPEEIKIDTNVRTDGNNLVVRVEMTNLAEQPQKFTYTMLAEGRRHQRIQINVGAGQTLGREFVWPDGAELVGKILTLKAEDRNSPMVLVYPVTVTR